MSSVGYELHVVDLSDKPGKFHGKASEWRDWSESVKAFVAVADPKLAERMEYYSTLPEPVTKATMDATDKRAATQLHYILVMLCKDKAAEKRRNVHDKENGLEAWRAFFSEWQPALQNRYAGRLSSILAQKF